MDDVTTIELDIRRNGADYRVNVVIAPDSVTNWVERLGPRKRHYSLMLMPLETGHMWAHGTWHYEAIGEALGQFDTTLEQAVRSEVQRRQPHSTAAETGPPIQLDAQRPSERRVASGHASSLESP